MPYREISVTPTYDNYGRTSSVESVASILGSPEFYSKYAYDYKTNGIYESGLVSQVVSTVGQTAADATSTTYNYTYDANGNITSLSIGGVVKYYYHYDNLGQLVRYDNVSSQISYVYTYDNAGNLLQKSFHEYESYDSLGVLEHSIGYYYSTSAWGDLLTYASGYNIIYDAIGNPTALYRNWTDGEDTPEYGAFLTWQGRELTKYEKILNYAIVGTYEYTYNADGIRTSKTVDGVKHEYLLSGSRIVSETWIENGVEHMLVYLYDEKGSPIGLKYRTSGYDIDTFQYYFFEKNLQGDIVAIFNDDGDKIGTYNYDVWGFCTPIPTVGVSATDRTIVTTYNPFRYRGYYYDVETGWYYLQSRYYNPNWCRFINADGYVSTGQGLTGYNMFAYCGNNPINRKDAVGQCWTAAMVIITPVAVVFGILYFIYPKPLPYKSADEAAMAFANSTYSSSLYIRHEYGTVIYSKTINGTTTYGYATPVAGHPHSVKVGLIKIPLGTTKVATAHTHPNSNSFSGLAPGATSGDIPNAIRRGLDSYVIGPNLNLQKYSISSGTVSIVGVASPVALTTRQQVTLVSQFQISWDNHLGTCAFGCNRMTWPTP